MALKRVLLVVRGRVQGAFFEATAQREARRLGLAGYVTDCDDGAVKLSAEGEEEELRELIAWAQKGPTASRVDSVDVRWGSYGGQFDDFRVIG